MAITFAKLFAPAALTTSAATYYTVASPYKLINSRVRFTNVTSGAVTVTAYAVPSGGSAADSNAILKGYSIAANAYLDIDLPVMTAGDFLQALASAGTSITIHAISGVLHS